MADKDLEMENGWKEIDNALSDPKLKNLKLIGVYQGEASDSESEELKVYFQENMPKSHKQGILQIQGNESSQ